jgi:2OG-Fe(II) oxygenase superfamily
MLRYDRVAFDYEPYPIGIIGEVFDPGMYSRLSESYPDKSLFQHMPHLGNKYSLSETSNSSNYGSFLKSSADWRAFYDYVRSKEFIQKTLGMLEANNIVLPLRKPKVVSGSGRRSRTSLLGRLLGRTELNARFEFAMMGGDGGHIKPHTDMPRKLITFVFSMIQPGEWNSSWGGSTDVVWPKDPRNLYNEGNKYFNFDQVNTLKKMAFNPNQAVIFIKTWNSWHAVSPLHAPSGENLRKTLTVNIERKV